MEHVQFWICRWLCLGHGAEFAISFSPLGSEINFHVSNHSWDYMQYVDRPGVCFCSRTTYDDNAITNAVEIYNTSRYYAYLRTPETNYFLVRIKLTD